MGNYGIALKTLHPPIQKMKHQYMTPKLHITETKIVLQYQQATLLCRSVHFCNVSVPRNFKTPSTCYIILLKPQNSSCKDVYFKFKQHVKNDTGYREGVLVRTT